MVMCMHVCMHVYGYVCVFVFVLDTGEDNGDFFIFKHKKRTAINDSSHHHNQELAIMTKNATLMLQQEQKQLS